MRSNSQVKLLKPKLDSPFFAEHKNNSAIAVLFCKMFSSSSILLIMISFFLVQLSY